MNTKTRIDRGIISSDGTHGEVVSEKLHDEGGVFVQILIECVQLRHG